MDTSHKYGISEHVLMFRLAVLVTELVGIVVSVSLGFLMLVTGEVASILVTASIGAPSLVRRPCL
jgi:hypothetical protein